MEITLEQIDLIRKRTGASYSEAKDVLEMYNGNVVEALSHFEKNSKLKTPKLKEYSYNLGETIKKLIQKGFEIRLIVSKESAVKLDSSLNLLIVALIFAFPITVGLGILAILTKHSLEFKSRSSLSVNKALCKISDKVSKTIDNFHQKPY